ncbi:MAG: hypothetical protein QNJ04_17535, partial [Desulfobacterales bacterium]|nr:hypothetical protein [Desulfobacterales bacterium]
HGSIRRRVIAWFGDAQDTRDTGAFFLFVFFHVEENYQTVKEIRPFPGSVKFRRIFHQRWRILN